jgi:FtsZ-binding cell division protein ZapB
MGQNTLYRTRIANLKHDIELLHIANEELEENYAGHKDVYDKTGMDATKRCMDRNRLVIERNVINIKLFEIEIEECKEKLISSPSP